MDTVTPAQTLKDALPLLGRGRLAKGAGSPETWVSGRRRQDGFPKRRSPLAPGGPPEAFWF